MARLLYGTTTYGLNASNREQNAASFLQADIDDLTDATALVFPAIGAALMLLFGGLLLTTALRCRLSDSKNGSFEWTDKRFSRTISFYNTPNELCSRGTSVLQQENNDIVDAVMKEYGDLSHYQPERDHNANLEQSFALSFSRPEMVDKGVSPIYGDCECSRSSSAGSSSPIQAHENAELEHKVDFIDRRTAISDQRNEPVFSGTDVRSQCSFDDDSLELFSFHQDKTQGQNAQGEGENSDSRLSAKLRSSCSNNGAVSDGDRRNVSLSERAPSSPSTKRRVYLLHRENSKRPREKAKRSENYPSRLRRSNLQSESDCSFGSASALSGDASDSKATVRPLQDPAASVTTENTLTEENVQRCDARSPMRKLALEKWLSEVQTFYPYHGIPPEMENSESGSTEARYFGTNLRRENLRPSGVNVGQERKCKTRTWPRAREMRRAQFNKDDPGARKHSPLSLDHSSGSDADVGESSGSWFNCVRRPYSPRCGVSTRLYTRGSGEGQKVEQRALDRMPNIVEKERLGSPQETCSADVRCDKGTYRGAQCQEIIHDSSESHPILATSKLNESHNFVEQQLRRASYFGGAQILAQPEGKDFHLRVASSLGDQGSALGTRCRGPQHGLVKEQLRGASSFGGTQILAQPESKNCPLRGASSLGDQGSAVITCRGAQHGLVRGASSFGGTQILRGASSLGGQGRRVTDNCDIELRGASVFGGSQIISQVIKRKPSRNDVLGLGNEPFQSEINALEVRNASSLEDAEECTSSITLTVARDSDEENSQCETDSLMSRRSYKHGSAVSVKRSNTVIAAKTSSTGMQKREQPCKEDKPQCASSDRCDHKHPVDSQVTDCTTWCARGRRAANCVETPPVVDGLFNAPEGSGVTFDESRRTPVRTNEAVRSTSKLSSDSILNVGKDICVMSAVLHALRQERDISRDRRKA